MKELKVSSAIISVAIFFVVTVGFIAFGSDAKGAKNIERPTQNQIAERREFIEVSRGGAREQLPVPEPKPLTFSGPNIPEHDQYIDERIAFYAKDRGVDPFLLAGMAWKESTFNPNAKGGNGFGLLQLEPGACETMGVGYPCTDINQNLWAGAGYYKLQLDKFGDERVALAAYNCGPTRVTYLVQTYGNTYEDIKPYLPRITRYHVYKVFEYREIFKQLNGQ